MIIVIAIFTSMVLITCMMRFLVKDFAKFVWKKTVVRNFPKSFIDFGEYFTTWFFVIGIAFMGFLFYKFGTVLIAYLFSGDLIEFFVILRNVFSVKSELQNPFIFQHMLAGFVFSPALQFLACFAIYKGIKSFMLFVNSRYGPNVYNESDLLYFSFVAVLIFMSCDIISFSQNIPAVSGFAHFLYLGISKLACICYYLTIAHNHLLSSNEYKQSLPKYINLKNLETKIILNPRKSLLLTYFVGIILNVPFVLGTQFLDNNLYIILVCCVSCFVFYVILKTLLAKGYNYIGAILFYHRINIENILTASKPLLLRNRKLLLMAASLLFICFSLYKPKILLFILLIIALSLVTLILAYSLGYFGFWGYSVLRARKFNVNVPPVFSPSFVYMRTAVLAFSKSVLPVTLFMILIITLLSVAPKKYRFRFDDTYVTSVIDKDGNPLHIKYNDANSCIPISYKEIPEFLVKCLIIQEDRDFFHQNSWFPGLANWHGVSIASLYRTILGSGGGSNLNMQLIKNIVFNRGIPIDIQRKFSEMLTAFQLSLQLSPEQIVSQYFNKVSWNGGNGHSGILLGSIYTFGMPVDKLNQLEMLYMVQSLKRGTYFKIADSLINYQDAVLHIRSIRKELLEQAASWHLQGLLSKKELNTMKAQELRFVNLKYKPLCQTATKDFLDKVIDKQDKNNITFQSSISIVNEQAMQTAIKDFHSELEGYQKSGPYDLYSAALVINVQNGQILGHYGSNNISDLTTLGTGRNMGSLIKPFIICELLETGIPANQIRLYDGPIRGQSTPQNYSRHYSYRYIDIDEALGRSLNAPLVNVRQLTNPITLFNSLENRFHEMGIPTDPHLQLNNERIRTVNILNYPLGSRNMTLFNIAQAYQTLFNEGRYIKLSPFESYYDPYKDSTIFISQATKQIFSPSGANRVKTALHRAMMESGTAKHLNKILLTKRMMYAKTGTTDKGRDGYCMLTDGEILIISYVSFGQITNNTIRLGLAPIPFGAGGRSAGILSALLYNSFSKL